MAFELDLISLFLQASFIVKLVLITLLIVSFASWWFIFEKYITFTRVKKDIFIFNKFFWNKNDLKVIFDELLKKEELVGLDQIFFAA